MVPIRAGDMRTAASESSQGLSESLTLALPYLGRRVRVVMDRPLGSRHPTHGFRYELNYGYIPGTVAPDGDGLDAYVLGPAGPVLTAAGTVVAIVHRLNDDDDKLVVVTGEGDWSNEEILTAVAFQERFGPHELVR